MTTPEIVIAGAGINGLVAANYLCRAGCRVTVIERADRVGGACVSGVADIDGTFHHYALGASVLGLMQDFVFSETGLSNRLQTLAPEHPKLVYFPGDTDPTRIHRDPMQLELELRQRWVEQGDIQAFRQDEARVVKFLQDGFRSAVPPSVEDAKNTIGETLTELWITGSARRLLDHYLTSDRCKIYMAMAVTESGPVSVDEPYSAFTIPLMGSGSVFGGYWGFVKGGIWKVTEELGNINAELGVTTHLASSLIGVDIERGSVVYENADGEHQIGFDQLILGTDPLTAGRLVGHPDQVRQVEEQRFRGSSGKLNLVFRQPIRWKYDSGVEHCDAAFRFWFAVSDLNEFEKSTLEVLDTKIDYAPGYVQVYCEGAAMRHLKHDEPFDRLAVFFKNLSLRDHGENLVEVENRVKAELLRQIDNPDDCVWSRLVTPRDLQELFLFPEGNLDHTMLAGGQTFFDRTYADDPAADFYRFGELENVSLCGAGTYPCGSVTGTPGYMCSQQLLRRAGLLSRDATISG